MKLTLVIVSSLDGKTYIENKQDHHVSWASKEDQDYFFNEIIAKARLILMGRKTYEASRMIMKHVKGRRRVVLTSTPERYQKENIPEILEFTNEKPQDLVRRLESEGFTEGFHVGGAGSATEFFSAGLITHVHQTLEPKIFGEGTGFVIGKTDISLTLLSSEKLNDNGTLLLKYRCSINS